MPVSGQFFAPPGFANTREAYLPSTTVRDIARPDPRLGARHQQEP